MVKHAFWEAGLTTRLPPLAYEARQKSTTSCGIAHCQRQRLNEQADLRAKGKGDRSSLPFGPSLLGLVRRCPTSRPHSRAQWQGDPPGASFAASFSETVAEPRAVFATMLLMFAVLIPLFFAKGLIEILGKDEIKRRLLKPHTGG